MIVLTVKTLDSQNHTFTVDDDITVEEFKTKIADTVNIPANTQRIIYCGRVLQDSAKLSDYDVNGKVVHLVQRAPPNPNAPTTRNDSPQPQRRGFRGFEAGNTMYLGSMAFPSNLMESQGIVPPPPTHSLAGSRLNVARRMLRRADAVINMLENPTARPSEQPNPEEQQEEEVTPIIEARVIVPPGNGEVIDEAMVLSAVQDTLIDAASGSIPMSGTAGNSGSDGETPSTDRSTSSTPEEAPAPNAEGARPPGVSARTLAENASRTSEMAELLGTLNQLQARFAPFLERYRQFMADDPIIPQENVRQTQAMLTRVSEVLHFLGHAYHSLSDIIIRVRTPPPRPLLCRPILIQHSAVVQAGIPIQVEAQFNLSTERPPNGATPTTAAPTTNTETPSSTTTTTTSGDTATSTPPTAAVRPQLNFNFIPGASMRVQGFPIEMRSGGRPVGNVNPQQRVPNNNNNAASGGGGTEASTTTSTPTATTTTSASAAPSGMPHAAFNLPNFNNSSVEFFMEVNPEVLQGSMSGPPPEFLQSLVQMAGQIMTRVTNAPPTEPTTTDASQSSGAPAPPVAGQNSQARVNTQTNPTTATHTRSTPRPHVHLAQQAMQGGFDPFLPCNSHHVTHRRRVVAAAAAAAAAQQSTARATAPAAQAAPPPVDDFVSPLGPAPIIQTPEQRERERAATQNLHNLFDEIYSSLRSAYTRRREYDTRQEAEIRRQREAGTGAEGVAADGVGGAGAEGASASGGRTGSASIPDSLNSLFPGLLANFDDLQRSTIADLLQQLPPDESASPPGESIITDLIMLLSRNLTLLDIITLNSGNVTPLNRVAAELQQFFNTRILEGATTPAAITSGVDRILAEMQSFFQSFSQLRVRDDIDVTRSIESLFRRRLPEIITTAATLSADNMRVFVNQCLSLIKTVCALALQISANGQPGVEATFQEMISTYLQGIPEDLQNWSTLSSCANLRNFMGNLGVSNSEIEAYIVRTTDVPMTTPAEQESQNGVPQDSEPMELDEPQGAAANNTQDEAAAAPPPLSLGSDEEPLPTVVLGSDPWHGQVPEDWVPIITRDVQRQRRQSPQAPFSDAYLSGMPTKRRKIVNSTKPQGSLPQVIAESVRRAVTSTGLSSVAPLEAVSQGAGDSTDVQAAYRNLLRTSVQTTLRENEDFTPERFPNASTYFKPQ